MARGQSSVPGVHGQARPKLIKSGFSSRVSIKTLIPWRKLACNVRGASNDAGVETQAVLFLRPRIRAGPAPPLAAWHGPFPSPSTAFLAQADADVSRCHRRPYPALPPQKLGPSNGRNVMESRSYSALGKKARGLSSPTPGLLWRACSLLPKAQFALGIVAGWKKNTHMDAPNDFTLPWQCTRQKLSCQCPSGGQ